MRIKNLLNIDKEALLNTFHDGNKKLAEIVRKHFWDSDILEPLIYTELGYGAQENEKVKKRLERDNSPTSIHVRYRPDFLVADEVHSNPHYLEYAHSTSNFDLDERLMNYNKYMNFKNLHSIGVKVALLYFAIEPELHLLCDFIEDIEVHKENGEIKITRGRGGDYVKFYASKMRTLLDFVVQEHMFYKEKIEPVFDKTCDELRSAFQLRVLAAV